eukprot:scaffold143913_cov19-Prasinocladus_malaysianus.AAC.1
MSSCQVRQKVHHDNFGMFRRGNQVEAASRYYNTIKQGINQTKWQVSDEEHFNYGSSEGVDSQCMS